MQNKQLREAIVNTVASFCKTNNIDYRTAWKLIYNKYGETYHIWPSVWYKFGHNSNLDFLESYEDLYGTLTKMYKLIKELK